MLLIQAILATIAAIGTLMFFRSNPPTPPSHSAKAENEKQSILKDLVGLLRNVNMVILLVVYGLGFGAVNCFVSIINQMVVGKKYDSVILAKKNTDHSG
jgi:Na+/melibiose symporter-like transporter